MDSSPLEPFKGPPASDEVTGVPALRSWRSVYIVVLVNFVLWVLLLAIFSRVFA